MNRFRISGMYCKLLTEEQEHLEFKNHYDTASGMNLPIEYFTGRSTYCFYNNSKMIAGYIIGTRKPFRTIDVFVNECDKSGIYSLINDGESCSEVCAFWMAKKSY